MKEEIKNLKALIVHQRIHFIYKTMQSYCLKCRIHAESKNPSVAKKNKGKVIISSKRALCDTKNSRFIKEQEASGLLRIKAALSKIPLIGPVLF